MSSPSGDAVFKITAEMVEEADEFADMERMIIGETLKSCRGNKTRTAAVLGISLKTLYNRLKEFANDAREGEPNTRTR